MTRLPEYLIPRRMVALDRLPLTGDGEHDTAALAAALAAEALAAEATGGSHRSGERKQA